jgi:hypothetical protein
MFCKPGKYSMILNKLSSMRSNVDDTRENSILADYGIRLWAIKAILKSLSSLKDSDIIDEWAAFPVVNNVESSYCLS